MSNLSRRDFLRLAGVGSLGLALPPRSGGAPAGSASRPNVLFIAIDDLNDWVGCMGGHPDARTPNIDRLASRGVLFTNAHCQAPICGPSRASLMSGFYPSTTGVYGQVGDNLIRRAGEPMESCAFLPEYLGGHGYTTMGVGKLFHEHAPDGVFDISGGREGGFGPQPPKRRHWDRKGTITDWGPFPDSDEEMPDYRTARWAVERLNEDHDAPFFLAAGFVRPHVPWHVPKKWFDLFDPDALAMPPFLKDDYADLPEIAIRVAEVPMMPTAEWAEETGQWRDIVQAYLACVAFTDHCVGQVLDALEQSPYAGNTIIVLWSDHGYHLGEKNRFAKHSLWERATRAPLIIAGPVIEGGKTCGMPVGLIDLYPTLLDLCGLPENPENEGHSLAPLLADPADAWPHAARTTYGRGNHAIRSEHHRYIVYENGAEELYDHRDDQDEWHNRAEDPACAAIKEEMRRHLPKTEVPWARPANLDVNDYFVEQKRRDSGREMDAS